MTNLADRVVAVVNRFGPFEADQISIKLVREFGVTAWDQCSDAELEDRGLVKLLGKLVEEGRLIEVEYVIRRECTGSGEVFHRSRSLLFPAATEIKVKPQGQRV